MAKQTYWIQSERNMTYCPDIPLTAVAGHPYQTELTAGLALFNRVGSNRIVKIVDVGINHYSRSSDKFNALTEPNTWFGRITTNTVGEGILTPVKHDSASASLPTQVVCSEAVYPSSNYFPSPMRRLRQTPLLLSSLALSAWLQKGDGMQNMAGSLFHDQVTSELQRMTIREGEGFAIVCSAPSGVDLDVANIYDLVITFKVGSATYTIYSDKGAVSPTDSTTHAFAMQIWNGAGSGVLVEIISVHYMDCGESIPNAGAVVEATHVETISYMDADNHEEATFVSRDSTNESLTGKVDYGTNARVHLMGNKCGSLIQRNILRRFVMSGDTMRVNTAPLGNFLPFGGREGDFIGTEIVLREGEGIAIFDRNTTMIGRRRRYIQFTVENNTAPSQPSLNIGI